MSFAALALVPLLAAAMLLPARAEELHQSERSATKLKFLLAIGEPRVVNLDFDPAPQETINSGNRAVAITQLVKRGDKAELVLLPLKAGRSRLLVRDKLGTLKLIVDATVTARNLEELALEISTLLKEASGIRIHIVGTKVVLDGLAADLVELGRAAEISASPKYSGDVLGLLRLSPAFFEDLAKRVTAEVQRHAPGVRARWVSDQLWLEGEAETIEQAKFAVEAAKLLLPPSLPDDPIKQLPNVKVLPPRAMIQNFIAIKRK